MQPELELLTNQWRATMPVIRPRAYTDLPGNLHPQLVNELYPLSVREVYTRTYKALIHSGVPGNLKHDLLTRLGSDGELHYLTLLLPAYRWGSKDLRRLSIWEQVLLEHSANVTYNTKTAAFPALITVGMLLSSHSRDVNLAPADLSTTLLIMENKADLPALCADLVAAADPYLNPQKQHRATVEAG